MSSISAMFRLRAKKRRAGGGGAAPAACAVCEDAVYAAATAHKAGYYVIGIADRTSAADEPEMRRICSQFVPRWDALDWTRV